MSERWMPGHGELYYFITTSGNVRSGRFSSYETCSDARLDFNNCFKTEEEARAAAEKVKALLLSLHEPVTDCNRLPKLTTEVFNRPDCPEWAKYAVVDIQGLAYWYQYPPLADERIGVWKAWRNRRQLIDGFFDRSDWQNSLVERPAKLPDWCKVGEWVWSEVEREYYKIVEVKFPRIKTGQICCEGLIDWGYEGFLDQCVPSRLRPYNAEEMKALMGKVIEKGPSMHIVTGFENVFDNECMVHVNGCLYSANDLLRQFTIDNAPCGVLEHLENGEWVH